MVLDAFNTSSGHNTESEKTVKTIEASEKTVGSIATIELSEFFKPPWEELMYTIYLIKTSLPRGQNFFPVLGMIVRIVWLIFSGN